MKKLLYLLPIVLVGFSCQKVIDVDLNEAEPKLVIEAIYTAEDSTVRVRITQTSSFFSASGEPTVDNASVSIMDENGVITAIPNVGDGHYQLSNYAPQFGTSYTVSVTHNGTIYTSTCEMNSIVDQLDIFYEESDQAIGGGGFGGGESNDTTYVALLQFIDPAEIGNYYQGTWLLNDTESNSLEEMILLDDNLTNGNNVFFPIFGITFEPGDSLEIDFRTVDKKIYDYYTELISLTDPSSAAPANPDYFWSNDALGYFNAYGNSRKYVVFP